MAETTVDTTASGAPEHAAYTPRHNAQSQYLPVRGLQYHVQTWGQPADATPTRPPLVMVHGWMDVGASFQFGVDALAEAEGQTRWVIAPDWRGFGLTATPGADTYWFPDYLADLEALLDTLAPAERFPRSTCWATAWAATSPCTTPACVRSASAAW